MELILQTDLTATPAIHFNFEELKNQLSVRLQPYNSLVVTEDTIKNAKDDKAKLNAFRKQLEDERIRIKKQVLQPYEEFEKKEKQLISQIDEAIANIDAQLKNHEERRKAEKKAKIEGFYNELIEDDLKEIIPLERIFDAKWLNATTSEKKIKEALDLLNKKTRTNLQAVDTVPEAYRTAVRAKYIETLDIGAALTYQKQLQAAEKAVKTEPEPAVEQTTLEPPKEAKWAKSEPAAPQQTETLYLLKLEMQLTKQQANGLKEYLANAGIQYRRI
jgi:hypothetical protein